MTKRADDLAHGLDVGVVEDSQTVRMIVRGALDADAAPGFSLVFERVTRQRQPNIVLDLAQVTRISSAGIGSLIAGIGEARDDGKEVVVDSMSDVVRHVVEMLDVLDYFAGPAHIG